MNFFSPAALVAFICLFFATSTPNLKAAGAPFHGKCSAVDTSAQTITLVGKKKTRVFHVLPTTKIVDGASNPSSLSAATPGEAVSGYYDTTTMNLSMLRIGAKTGSQTAKKEAAEESAPAASTSAPAPAAVAPAAAPAAASPEPAATTTSTKAKKSRFSGKVASVNVAGDSVVVHGETVMVDSSTKMTDATGAAITLSDLAAGDKISGSAMKAADGTMTAVTLKKSK